MDAPTTKLHGRTVLLNPGPDNLADRLAWALSDADSIGASRRARGWEELGIISKEMGITIRDLAWFLETIYPRSED